MCTRRTILADNQYHFVPQLVWQLDAAQLKAAAPPGHIIIAHSVEHRPELLGLGIIIGISRTPAVTVEFLIIIVLHTAAHSGQQAVTLAHSMLSAATGITRCPVRLHRVIYPATHPHDCRDNARSQYQCQYPPHTHLILEVQRYAKARTEARV